MRCGIEWGRREMGNSIIDCQSENAEVQLLRSLKERNGDWFLQVINNLNVSAVWDIRRSGIFDCLDEIAKEENLQPRLAEGIIALLMKLHDLPRARLWLEKGIGTEGFRMLKLADLHRREGNVLEMKNILDRSDPPESFGLDEWRYLRFFILERTGESEKGDLLCRRLSVPEYIMRSRLILAERHLSGRNYSDAEKYLKGALGFFMNSGWEQDVFECRLLLAKSAWMRKMPEGEKILLDLWNASHSGKFPGMTARIATDLGNMFLFYCDWKRAEEWTRRAVAESDQENTTGGACGADSLLGNIEILNGDWRIAEVLFRRNLEYSRRIGFLRAEGIALLDIARLKYLRLDFSGAWKTIEEAKEILLKSRFWTGYIDCLFLMAKIRLCCHQPVDFSEYSRRLMSEDQIKILRIIQNVVENRTPSETRLNMEESLRLISSYSEQFDMIVILRRYYGWSNLQFPGGKKQESGTDSCRYFKLESESLNWEEFSADPAQLETNQSRILWELIDYFHLNRRILPHAIRRLHCFLTHQFPLPGEIPSRETGAEYCTDEYKEKVFRCMFRELSEQAGAERVYVKIFDRSGTVLSNLDNERDRQTASRMIKGLNGREWRMFPQAPGDSPSSAWVGRWRISMDLEGIILITFPRMRSESIDYIGRYRNLFSKYASAFRRIFEGKLNEQGAISHILGESKIMRELKEKIIQVAKVPFSLLITGESGTGKELVARAVHFLGVNSQRPFVCVNSAAIPDQLLEAELFGFKKGAFTGAVENRTGLIESAAGGTLFLDEIADLSLPLQAKLLRVLQEKEIRRIGENASLSVDFRLISASNKDLLKMVGGGRFREDLYYRLQDLRIHVPPLRDRIEDIPELIDHFLKKHSGGLAEKQWVNYLCELFRGREFRGNVRELESEVKKAITFSPSSLMSDEAGVMYSNGGCSLKQAREKFERDFLQRVLKENDWNRNVTASGLKISRMTLFNLMKKYDLLFMGDWDKMKPEQR